MTYDWEELKPEICELYLAQNLTLDAVAEAVNRRHGVDIRNRTFREKLKEWNCRKSDYRGRTKSRSSAISTDSGYASYSTLSLLSPTASTSSHSYSTSTSTSTLTPSIHTSHIQPSSPSSTQHTRRPSGLQSPSKPNLNRPLPPLPQSPTDELEIIAQRTETSRVTSRHSVSVQPLNTKTSTLPPHSPASQCSRARRDADLPRITTLRKCTECGASKLHSLMACGLNTSIQNFTLIVESEKASINSQDIYGNTCLHAAAASGLGVNDFKILLGAGANLLARNNKGETFLHVLSPRHSCDSLFRILEWATDQNLDMCFPTFDGKTVLHTLCERNVNFLALTNMWPFLQGFGSRINSRDRKGKSPIDYLKTSLNTPLNQGACSGDLSQGLENLLVSNLPRYESSQGMNDGVVDDENDMLESWTNPEICAQRDIAMLDIVRRSENESSIQDDAGRNALHCLAYIIRYPEFNDQQQPSEARHDRVRSCLGWEVDPNAYDRRGSTPLHSFLAHPRSNDCESSLARIVDTLLQHGADPNMRDRHGNTALHLACHYGRLSCVEVLLRFFQKDARLHNNATRARNDAGRSPVKETLAWMNVHTPSERRLRQQCLQLLSVQEFTEDNPQTGWWAIPNSTPAPNATATPQISMRPPTPMDES